MGILPGQREARLSGKAQGDKQGPDHPQGASRHGILAGVARKRGRLPFLYAFSCIMGG